MREKSFGSLMKRGRVREAWEIERRRREFFSQNLER
jgi:hypothetical protein